MWIEPDPGGSVKSAGMTDVSDSTRTSEFLSVTRKSQGIQAGSLRYSPDQSGEVCAPSKSPYVACYMVPNVSRGVRVPDDIRRYSRMTSCATWFVLVVCVAALVCGCQSTKKPSVTIGSSKPITISYSDTVGILRYEGHPVIRGSINGVSGNFVIDTGATIPILGIAAARECRFKPFWPPASDRTNSFWGEKIVMMKATNIVAEFAHGFSVHWPEVLVSGEEEFFGIIDYRTLKEANAVIDTKNKTITVAK